ncbi:unnamed protein product [Adineta steineri]|uniref:Exonuclease domain-containing protein n=1 Tax=Adineta steineri TaxID=433720 RepID=A0A814G255_9BILA|nr:unnamed protein product [Adineta steineri]CAF1176438.1 unnamed protein product [Adineta steineri]CAF1409904.1 unnamed protein product [Adineta steineri]CAF1617139.1 unnamed protein product [Adineta steineri]
MSNLIEEQIDRLSYNVLLKELAKRNLSTRGNIDILKTRLTCSCKGYEEQVYKFVAVIDFEATCTAKPPNPYIQEIIEFPVVLIDVAKQEIVDTFHSYCKPVRQPILSDYCKQLTGITQEQVNNALVFTDVFINVERWLNDRNLISDSEQKCLFITDGPSDFKKYLRMQCEISHIIYPNWAYQWFNVKKTFSDFYFVMPGRIQNMLENLHLPFHGNLHSGLDDAINIGRIVIQLIQDGCVLVSNEYYALSRVTSGRNTLLSTAQYDPAKMICLNCSKSHFKDQRSCMEDAVKRIQRSKSHHSQIHSNRSISSKKIPSLLDLPYPSCTNSQTFRHQSSSSRLS